jgi:hypothetical protein
MQADPYTRAILTFIALCLLLLVARGFGVGEPEAPPPDPATERGRWTLQMMRTGLGGPPTLVRFNTATGEVWQLRLGANQEWALEGVVKEAARYRSAPPAPPSPPSPADPSAGAPQAAPPAPQAAPQP